MKDQQTNLDLYIQDDSSGDVQISLSDLMAQGKKQILSFYDLSIFGGWSNSERYLAGIASVSTVYSIASFSNRFVPFSFRAELSAFNGLCDSIYSDFCGPIKVFSMGVA